MSGEEEPDDAGRLENRPGLSVVASGDGTDAGRGRLPRETAGGANDEALLLRIAALEEDHGDLGKAIDALEARPGSDRLTVARLKKKKLQLKDEIQRLRNALTPDIIA